MNELRELIAAARDMQLTMEQHLRGVQPEEIGEAQVRLVKATAAFDEIEV